MPSVATPEYVVEIKNPTPVLPPVSERTPEMVMSAIKSWEYWQDIKRVALKEYGMAPEKFDVLLPEYQRYLALFMLGYTPLGMFSLDVDKIWHSHVLCSHLWADFTLRLHGTPINHVAQVPLSGTDQAVCKCSPDCKVDSSIASKREGDGANCTVCKSCTNCSGGGQGGVSGLQGTAQEFIAAYFQTFGVQPPAIWNLAEAADACASE